MVRPPAACTINAAAAARTTASKDFIASSVYPERCPMESHRGHLLSKISNKRSNRRKTAKSRWSLVRPFVRVARRLRDLPDDATKPNSFSGGSAMSRILRFVAAALAFAVAAPALAQVQTGSILVRAVDDQGAVVPGVTVTITSSVLVAGSMTGVTDAGGVFRFPSLVPGTYGVKVELSGFRTVNRESIVVLVGQTTPLDFQMKVASLSENITVTGASPTVDTTTANQNVHLGEMLIQGTPGGRDIWALVESKVPSLVISRPDVGGTSGGLQGTFSARGTASAQNASFLNGINVGDPAAIGAAGFYYDIDAFDDIQVSTGAHDITVPTSGVFLNMVTKTGGNAWGGRTTFTWTGDSLQGRNDTDPTLQKYGFRPNGNTSDFVSDVNLNAGGPLVQ